MTYGKDTLLANMTKLKPYNNHGPWRGHMNGYHDQIKAINNRPQAYL